MLSLFSLQAFLWSCDLKLGTLASKIDSAGAQIYGDCSSSLQSLLFAFEASMTLYGLTHKKLSDSSTMGIATQIQDSTRIYERLCSHSPFRLKFPPHLNFRASTSVAQAVQRRKQAKFLIQIGCAQKLQQLFGRGWKCEVDLYVV